MGMIKDRSSKYLIEAEEIKKRGQDYTKNHTKKILMTWIITMMWSVT